MAQVVNKHRISVIIATSGRSGLLKRTLDSLARCKIPAAFHELVVVENGYKGDAEKLVSQLQEKLNARYLFIERGNKSNALNQALKSMDDTLIFFSDDDVRFSGNLLEAYVKAAGAYEKGVFFGGPVSVDREIQPPDWMEELLPFSAKGYDLITRRLPTGYLGFNWAAFAADIRNLGGFNQLYGPGSPIGATGQETEIQERMIRNNFQMIDVMDAVVWHYVPESRCNEAWMSKRYFKYGIFSHRNSGKAGKTRVTIFEILKYSFRWFIYLLLHNKQERKRSKMNLISRIGYLYSLLTN